MTGALTIGVLITYYGERELLHECLESLQQQTQPVDEILVYDDASDAPPDSYIPDGMSVKVLRGATNRGPAHGRNQLLAASTTDYVHFHDADDVFAPEWHARVRSEIEQQDVDAVFTEVDAVRETGADSPRVLGLQSLIGTRDLLRFCINGVMLVPAGTYRRDRVLGIDGYRTTLWQSEDFDFHVRLAATGITYAVIPESLVTIRVRAASRSQQHVEALANYVRAVGLLAKELPIEYIGDLADSAARAGSRLHALGAKTEASEAFKLAQRLGPPRFTTQRRAYRVIASTIGFQNAENIAGLYRRLLPSRVRQLFA
ncbi:MAG: glycosyltransferase family 2 protein [Chloroflexi bacterium]|nr:glycosyltransferase family 2 protein [Chloroflexota bacterium]MBV9892952.1 glycosyltransferase family 2 protein [Chloroflexota bacterium]